MPFKYKTHWLIAFKTILLYALLKRKKKHILFYSILYSIPTIFFIKNLSRKKNHFKKLSV